MSKIDNNNILNVTPIHALQISTRLKLSQYLNAEQLITTETGLSRDYRGIGQLMGFSYSMMCTFARASDPTKCLIDAYEKRSHTSSVYDLLNMIETIERYDIIDDLKPFIQSDAENYAKIIRDSNGHVTNYCDNYPPLGVQYDAYVCYANENIEFVESLCKYLESPHIGIRLYIRDRDLPLGTMEYDYFTRLIESQCRRVLIILSPDFLRSAECEFQARFAAGLAIEQRCRKLIPIIYKSCDLPPIIRMLTKIDMSRGENTSQWALSRLINSLKNEVLPINRPLNNSVQMPHYQLTIMPSSESKIENTDESNKRFDSFNSNNRSLITLPSFPPVPTAPLLSSSSSLVISELSSASNTKKIPIETNASPIIENGNGQRKKWLQTIKQKFKA